MPIKYMAHEGLQMLLKISINDVERKIIEK